MGCAGAKRAAADESPKAGGTPSTPIVRPSSRASREDSAKRLFEFTEREEAEVYSFRKDRWFPCIIKTVYLADTLENGSIVPKNTIKVEFAAGTKYVQAEDIEAELRKKGSASPAPSQRAKIASRGRGQEARSLQGFSEGECVEMWSHRKGEWISCYIKAVYLCDTLEEECIVPENTIKVVSENGVKYVRYVDIPFALRHPPSAELSSMEDIEPSVIQPVTEMVAVPTEPMCTLPFASGDFSPHAAAGSPQHAQQAHRHSVVSFRVPPTTPPAAVMAGPFDAGDRVFHSPCRSPAASAADLHATEAAMEAMTLAYQPSVPVSEVIDVASRATTKSLQQAPFSHLQGQSASPRACDVNYAWQSQAQSVSPRASEVNLAWQSQAQSVSPRASEVNVVFQGQSASPRASEGGLAWQARPDSKPASACQSLAASAEPLEIDFKNPNWFKEYRSQLRSAGIGEGSPKSLRSLQKDLGGAGASWSGSRPATGPQPKQDLLRTVSISPRSTADTGSLGGGGGGPKQHPPSPTGKSKAVAKDKKPRAWAAQGGRSGKLVIVDKNAQAAPKVAYAWGGADRDGKFSPSR